MVALKIMKEDYINYTYNAVKEIDNETEEQFDSGEVLAETPKGKESPFDKR